MFLDERADAEVRRLWRRLSDEGLPSLQTHSHGRHRPHVSLTVASDWDPLLRPEVLADVALALDSCRHLDPVFQSLGTFAGADGILFLAGTATAPMLTLHEQVSEALNRHGVTPWSHYLPGRWVPHCTLAMGLSSAQLPSAVGLLYGFPPLEARVVEIGLTDTSTGTVTAL